MRNTIKLRYINYFYIFLVIIWRPLHAGIIQFDGKGRTILFLTILVFFFNVVLDKKIGKKILTTPMIYWAILIFFSLLNSLYKGFESNLPIIYFFIIKLTSPFLIMVISVKEYKRDNYNFVRFAVVVFIIFGLLDFIFLTGKSTIIDSVGRKRTLLGNASPLNMIFLFFLTCLLYVKKQIKILPAILLTVFSFSSVFVNSTRKALGAAMIMLMFLILSQLRFTPRRIAIFLIFIFSLLIGGNYVLNNTIIGKRIAGTEEQVSKNYNTSNINSKALFFLGDRTIQYMWAWELFIKNPITGIGLLNFTKQSPSVYVIHSEYMAQLCENGIIGAGLLLLFIIWFLKTLYKKWKQHINERKTIWVLTGGLLAIMFIQFTSWTYSFPQYFLVYGIIIGHLTNIRNENWYTRR